MKIYFDNLIYSWQRNGGISVVWTELLKRVVAESLPCSFIEFEGGQHNNLRKTLSLPSDRVEWRKPLLPKLSRYCSINVKESSPFLFHSSYYRTCRNKRAINIITVHDFVYELYMSGLTKAIHTYTKHKAIRDADCVVCISESTKSDLLHFFPDIDAHKVRVIYNGVSEAYRLLPTDVRYKAGDEPLLVFIGGRKGYKNFDIAVETAQKANMRLVIVGGKLSDEEEQYVASVLGDNYEAKGFMEEEALNALLNQAFALIYPSSYEGFGLPVIEAQRAGCPVLALNSSSIPEVIGDPDLLVPNKSVPLFVKKIEELKNPDYRDKVVAFGLENAKRFSWDKMFEEYLSLYKELAQQG